MKILFVLDTLESGGMQLQVLNLLTGLSESDYKVTVLVYNGTEDSGFYEEKVLGLDVSFIKLKGGPGFKPDVVLKLNKLLVNENYDVVASFLPPTNLYVTIARLLSPLRTRQSRHVCVDMSILTSNTPIKIWFSSLISHLFCDVLVCNSITQVSLYKKIFRGWSKALFISNGVDIDHYLIDQKLWSFKENRFLVIARIAPAKNGPNFIRALKKVSTKINEPIEVDWVGRVEESSEAWGEKETMDELIPEIALKGINWSWIGEVGDPRPYYSKASCLVIPSKWEGVPNVLIEAMLSGCLVISSNISDLGSILDYGNRGIVIDGTDPDAIATAIDKFMELDEKERFTMCESAQKYAIENYSLQAMVSLYDRLFKEINKPSTIEKNRA